MYYFWNFHIKTKDFQKGIIHVCEYKKHNKYLVMLHIEKGKNIGTEFLTNPDWIF